jgi:uncharacterized protein involved in type VI secretion and phage assembly
VSHSGQSAQSGPPFYGKYRGVVQSNGDPLMLGRVQVSVPAVYGTATSGWALPCMPFGGSGMGFSALPSVGALVWVEFEQGDPRKPIWSGCFWGTPADVPPVLLAPPYKKVLLQTEEGHSVLLDDTQGVGGITLTTATGETMKMTSQGITLQTAGGVKLSLAPQGITLQTPAGDGLTVAAQGVTLQTAAGDQLSLATQGTALQTAAGAKVSLGPSGITVDNATGATVALTGPQVSINNGALGVV